MQLFNDLLPGDLQGRWDLREALAVNEDGLVLGVGTHDGRAAVWLAVPVDPVVFIHGTGASKLWTADPDGNPVDEVWLSCATSRLALSLWPGERQSLVATDALRSEKCFIFGEAVNPALNIYGTLLGRLQSDGGYLEYQREDRPARQTEAGCDTSQIGRTTESVRFRL